MRVAAVLIAVLALAVPMQRTVSADAPTIEVEVIDLVVPQDKTYKEACVEFDETTYDTTETVEYETACLKITATGVNATNFPDLDWRLIVDYETNTYDDHTPPSIRGGPGYEIQTGQESYAIAPSQYEHDATAETVTAMVKLERLVPASDYTVEVKIVDKTGNTQVDKAETSTTFSTKSGCVSNPEWDINEAWHGGGGPGGVVEPSITRTSMTVRASVTHAVAPLNSGRCMHYTVNGVLGSAHVYYRGSGGRYAWVFLSGLQPSTYYSFTFSTSLNESKTGLAGYTAGFGDSTKGPKLDVQINDIEQTSATVNVALPADELESMGERQVHLVYYETADEHELDRSDVKPTPKTTADGSTSFSLTGLSAATEYKVKASLFSGFPTYKTESKTFPTKPGKPTGLAVTPGDTELEVSWTRPAGGDVIDEYIVEWQDEDDFDANTGTPSSSSVSPTDTTFTITGLDNGTDYVVWVIAKNVSGETASDNAFGTPKTIPDAPTNLDVAPGDTKLTLSWEAVPVSGNGGESISNYRVQWKADTVTGWDAATGVTEVSVTVEHHEIVGLTNGASYDVRVRADNGVVLLDSNDDEDHDSYNWVTGDGMPRPDPIVTGVTVADATITQTTATATVAIENQTGDGQTVHLQYRKNTESGWTTPTPKDVLESVTSETFGLSGLDGNTTYVVQAWLAETPGTIESVEFTTDPVKPGPPTNVRITGTGDDEITVAWDAPADNGGSAITGYKVQWKPATQANWDTYTERDDPDDQSPYTISENLVNGTAYDVRVIAVNDVDDSDPSGDVEGTPSTTPGPPTGVDVSDYGDRWLEVTWTEPTDKGGLTTTYIVQWKSGSDDFSETNQATPVTSPYKITNLTNGTEYTVRVLAENDRGKSDASNTDTGTPSTKPQPPTGVNISGYGDGTLTVEWVAPTGANTGGSAITGYKIQWKENATANWDSPSESNDDDGASPFEVSSLTNGTKYDVRVIAVNINGDSNPSESASGTPSKKPDKLTGVRISDYGDGWLEVTWVTPTGAATGGSPITGYIVQWKSGTDDDEPGDAIGLTS